MKKYIIFTFLALFLSVISYAQEPVININTEAIPFGEVASGDSYVLGYTLSAENLTEDITISVTPGQGFLVSDNYNSNWAYSYTLNHTGGTISETTIYVKFTPTAETDYATNISHTSADLTYNLPVSGTGSETGSPYIFLDPHEINFGTIPVGDVAIRTFDFTIRNVGADETAYIGFPVASGFSNENGGDQIIYYYGSSDDDVIVMFTPPTEGYFEGDVLVQGQLTGVTKYLHVTATAIIPRIAINETEHNFGEVEIDNPSAEFTYTVTGTTLYNDITIDAPYGFEISLTSGSNFTNQIILSNTDGNINDTQIFVRFAPQITTPYSGEIIHETEYGETQTITLSGIGVPAGTPIISISKNNFEFENTEVGSVSEEQIYVVSGINLIDDITITAPDGFEISETSETDFTNEIILTGGETIENTNIYIRFAPQTNQLYSGIVTHTSSDATQQEIAVSGNTATEINNLSEDNFNIYPNPSNGVFTIENLQASSRPYSVSVTDITGKTVNQQYVINNQQFVIDISNQPVGIYFLNIVYAAQSRSATENGIYTTKLITQ